MTATGAESLHRSPLFASVSDRDREGVAATGERVSFQTGEAIVEKGQPGDAMYVLLEGAAEVDVGGRHHRLRSGDFFGEMALIMSKRRTATVRAVEPVRALRIPADRFREFLLEHPAVGLAMLKGVVERLREVQDRIDAWMGTG